MRKFQAILLRKSLKVKENNMDINEIKKIIREDKAKIIIVDEQGPSLVVMDYAEYKTMKSNKGFSESVATSREAMRPHQSEVRIERMSENRGNEDALRIEDLPF